MSQLDYTFLVRTEQSRATGEMLIAHARQQYGLSFAEEGDVACYRGRLTPIGAAEFAAYLGKLGLEYEWKRPRYDEFKNVDLREAIFFARRDVRALYQLTGGGRTVATLTRRSFFNDVMVVQRNLPSWNSLASILRFMIDYRVDFSDLSPRDTFKTPLEKLKLKTHTHNLLVKSGIEWIELLELATPGGLLDIRQFGEKSLAEVETVLARHGKHLRV